VSKRTLAIYVFLDETDNLRNRSWTPVAHRPTDPRI